MNSEYSQNSWIYQNPEFRENSWFKFCQTSNMAQLLPLLPAVPQAMPTLGHTRSSPKQNDHLVDSGLSVAVQLVRRQTLDIYFDHFWLVISLQTSWYPERCTPHVTRPKANNAPACQSTWGEVGCWPLSNSATTTCWYLWNRCTMMHPEVTVIVVV